MCSGGFIDKAFIIRVRAAHEPENYHRRERRDAQAQVPDPGEPSGGQQDTSQGSATDHSRLVADAKQADSSGPRLAGYLSAGGEQHRPGYAEKKYRHRGYSHG